MNDVRISYRYQYIKPVPEYPGGGKKARRSIAGPLNSAKELLLLLNGKGNIVPVCSERYRRRYIGNTYFPVLTSCGRLVCRKDIRSLSYRVTRVGQRIGMRFRTVDELKIVHGKRGNVVRDVTHLNGITDQQVGLGCVKVEVSRYCGGGDRDIKLGSHYTA